MTGGDILEITCNHPTLGSKTLFPKSGEASSFDLGGFRSKDDANGIAGDGSMIDIMTQVRGGFEAVVANDMNVNNELEFVSAVAADPIAATWVFTVINGISYTGSGKPVGDLTGDVDKATFKLKVSGSKFVKI